LKRIFGLFLLVAAFTPQLAWAQSTAAKETTIPGGTLVVITYFGFVLMMMGYMALLSFRQRKLDRDINALEKRLDELAELQ
jgi:hypothetical protein